MSAVPKPRKLTVQEYLANEETAGFKSDYLDGVTYPVFPPAGPQMMAGASREHNIVFRNLFGQLFKRLEGGPCQLFAADQKVKVDRTGLYTYPDILIVCGEAEYAADGNTLTNPRVVLEVLSDSTEKYDRTTKFLHLQRLPSVYEYVLAAQDEPLVERYSRQPDGTWERTDFAGPDAALLLATGPVELPLADIYRGVTFPPRTRPGPPAT